eukprot:c22526_g3_i2 orf=53-865(+)
MVAKSAAASTKSSTTTTGSGATADNKKRFKGVRMRSWGKWVSEIRLPNTRARLWLGSYATAEQAARAFDVALVCLRGRSAALNFPDSPPAYAPLGLPHHQIQELAAFAAAAAPPPAPFDSRANAASQVDSPAAEASEDESQAHSWDQCSSTSAETEADTRRLSCGQCSSLSSASAGFGESEGATTNEMRCSLPVTTAQESGSLEELLLLDAGDDEQSSPLSCISPFAGLVSDWEEELLWGDSISSHSQWDQHLFLLPPLPVDDELHTITE